MDRLTFDGNFCDIAQCTELPCKEGMCSPRLVWERLKVYEDAEEFERMSESKDTLYKPATNHRCNGSLAAKVSVKHIGNEWRLIGYEHNFDYEVYCEHYIGKVEFCPFCGIKLGNGVQIKR